MNARKPTCWCDDPNGEPDTAHWPTCSATDRRDRLRALVALLELDPPIRIVGAEHIRSGSLVPGWQVRREHGVYVVEGADADGRTVQFRGDNDGTVALLRAVWIHQARKELAR